MLLVAVVLIAAVGGAAIYLLFNTNVEAPESIRIGICADLDNTVGKGILQAATLAVEQVNAEGGVLG